MTMKMKPVLSKLSLALLAGWAIAPTTLSTRADTVIDSFDNEATAEAWTATWGSSPVLSWSSEDSKGSASSGSLKVTADYFTPEDNGWEQMVITRTFASPVIGSEYVSVSVDVKVDPASAATAAGQYGYFEFKRPDSTAMGGVNLASTNWTTVTFPLAPTEGSLTGIIIQNGNGGFLGPVTYYLDNFKFNAPPATKTVIDSLDNETSAEAWTATWGSSPVLSWDPQDSSGSATSGSLKVSADYFTPEDNGWEQMVITRSFDPAIVGSDYTSVSVDIKVDPSSVPTTAGQYGYFEFKRPDSTAMGGVNLTSTNWTTITFPLSPTEGELTGIIIQNGNGAFQGPITYYLDNLVFSKPTSGPTAPRLAISKSPSPGLKLFASAPGQAYQRQNVVYAPSEDLASQLWWVNQNAPVTYSVTWADFPDKNAYQGFQGHVILSADSSGDVSPDWTDPNVILVEFQYANTAGADGTNGTSDDVVMARARFLHKVNEAAANGMLYRTQANAAAGPVGVLGEVLAPSMIGTWSITFKDNTHVTLTSSDGSTTDLVIPDADAALYEPANKGVSALFGVQPNADTRVGLSAIISRIKITKGATVVVDDNFQAAQLDTEKWTVRAQDAGGVFTTTPDLAYLVSWSLPDAGFALRSGPSVTGPWTQAADPLQVGARRVSLINKSALPAGNVGIFQLIKK